MRRGTFVRDIIARESLTDKPPGGPTFSCQTLVRRRALVFVGLKCLGQADSARSEGTFLHADAHVSARHRGPRRTVRDPGHREGEVASFTASMLPSSSYHPMALPGTSWHYGTEPRNPNSQAISLRCAIFRTASEAGGRAFKSRPGHHCFSRIAMRSRYGPAALLVHAHRLRDEGQRFAMIGKPCEVAAIRNLGRIDPRVEQEIPYFLKGISSPRAAGSPGPLRRAR